MRLAGNKVVCLCAGWLRRWSCVRRRRIIRTAVRLISGLWASLWSKLLRWSLLTTRSTPWGSCWRSPNLLRPHCSTPAAGQAHLLHFLCLTLSSQEHITLLRTFYWKPLPCCSSLLVYSVCDLHQRLVYELLPVYIALTHSGATQTTISVSRMCWELSTPIISGHQHFMAGNWPLLLFLVLRSSHFQDFLRRALQKNPESRWGAQQLLTHPFAYAGRDGRALKELIAEAKAEVTEVIEAEVEKNRNQKNLMFSVQYSQFPSPNIYRYTNVF